MFSSKKNESTTDGSLNDHARIACTRTDGAHMNLGSDPLQVLEKPLIVPACGNSDFQTVSEVNIDKKQCDIKRTIDEGLPCVQKKQKKELSTEQLLTGEEHIDMNTEHSSSIGHVAECVEVDNKNILVQFHSRIIKQNDLILQEAVKVPGALPVSSICSQGVTTVPQMVSMSSSMPKDVAVVHVNSASPHEDLESLTSSKGVPESPTSQQGVSVNPTSLQCVHVGLSTATSPKYGQSSPSGPGQCSTINLPQQDSALKENDDVKWVKEISSCTLESSEQAATALSPRIDENTSYYERDFKQEPRLITEAKKEYNLETNNFLKGCKWAPDGSCILTNSDDKCMRIFNLPGELFSGQTEGVPEMEPALKIQEAELIYDYTWYPLMNSTLPETCCFVSTSRDTPVHMWDAFTGKLRCSYRAYDQMDEITAAHSVRFSLDGMKLYCGFNKMIRVFDVTRPGRDFQNRPTFAKQGQPGIISCIAMNPTQPMVYAAGSYSRSIGVYNEPSGQLEFMFQGQVGGVTCLTFSPDGSRLYSGGRKDPEILCWDLRNPGNVLFTLQRQVLTNQRMDFDLDRFIREAGVEDDAVLFALFYSDGQYLVSGSHDGSVLVWDTQQTTVELPGQAEPTINSTLTFPAHRDPVNGVSLHPTMPVVASASGQRNFPLPSGLDLESESDEETGVEEKDEAKTESKAADNCLRLWWVGG